MLMGDKKGEKGDRGRICQLDFGPALAQLWVARLSVAGAAMGLLNTRSIWKRSKTSMFCDACATILARGAMRSTSR